MPEPRWTDWNEGLNRRTLLGLLGTAPLAGCLGPGDGGDNGDGGGTTTTQTTATTGTDTGGSTTAIETTRTTTAEAETTDFTTATTTTDEGTPEPSFCANLTEDDVTRYDPAESPFVATFEHPGEVIAEATSDDERSLTVRLELQDGQPIDMFPTQDLTGTDELTPAERGDLEGLAVVDELDYAGERLPVVRAEGGGNADDGAELYAEYPYYIVGLPHEGSSGKQYYRLDLRATVQFADDLEATVCAGSWERVARRWIQSLEPNPDTTVESANST